MNNAKDTSATYQFMAHAKHSPSAQTRNKSTYKSPSTPTENIKKQKKHSINIQILSMTENKRNNNKLIRVIKQTRIEYKLK